MVNELVILHHQVTRRFPALEAKFCRLSPSRQVDLSLVPLGYPLQNILDVPRFALGAHNRFISCKLATAFTARLLNHLCQVFQAALAHGLTVERHNTRTLLTLIAHGALRFWPETMREKKHVL